MLEVDKLSVAIGADELLHNVTLSVGAKEIVGIVGESGSGKTMTALSIMGLLPDNAKITSGSICFRDTALTELTSKQMQQYRGNDIAMIFQEPMTFLNPVMRIGEQLTEVIKVHPEARSRENITESDEELAKRTLERVGLNNAEHIFKCYPHELSGGMRQRVMIAMAILLHPYLLIADEPTTALDVTVQRQLLELLKELNMDSSTHSMSILFITHDLQLARNFCDRIIVMKDGRIEEQGESEEIFLHPSSEYTKKLIMSVPSRISGRSIAASESTGLQDETENNVIEVAHLNAYYKKKKGGFRSGKEKLYAVRDVSFTIGRGEILGLVGESGCGKTSLAKAVLGINKDIDGDIQMKCGRPRMVFQDPYSSLNPAHTMGWLLEEPLRAVGVKSRSERRERAISMLAKVGLDESYYMRYPHELSGGQRQRFSIGQALITNPQLIIADEPVSALDVTIQAQIMELMLSLQKQMGLSYLFISHDMNVINKMCDRVMVMEKGRIIETAGTEELFENPQTEYTRQLLRAAWL